MKFKDHCKESIEKSGKPFKEVHEFPDAFAGTKEFGMKHRKKRHHLKGIRDVVELFGEEAGKAARKHIISDLKEEGWIEKYPFPKDEADYVKMGLY